ncbi:MAG: dienelactone hydrolase family protein [Gloeocapsa sp. UFS-A4-WI-NPMV-4B04]|nr:dienelactone hydrolase family protein [Gloeocapsa sp. UFS-A4-WI-NPMV-4B04]
MTHDEHELPQMVIRNIKAEPLQDGYQLIRLETNRGNIDFHYYSAPDTQRGAIWVGGVGGGWDTPANGLYPRLCQELSSQGIASLRVRYRQPTSLEESVLDVCAGMSYLESKGIELVALTGHSFGGAVVIQAAAISEAVRAVVTLATQSYGAAVVSQLPPECEILLIHGTVDSILTPACSKYVYKIAHQPKRLILYEGADHNLDEVAEEVYQVVHNYILEKLK